MELDWIETIGFAGTGFTILAYGARQLVPLRILGIGSSLAFLAYGLLTHSYPLVIWKRCCCRSTPGGWRNCLWRGRSPPCGWTPRRGRLPRPERRAQRKKV